MIVRGLAIALTVAVSQCGQDPLAGLQSDHRAIEARLTGFHYAAFGTVRGGDQTSEPAESARLRNLREQAARQPTPENLHRLALADLAGGHAESARTHLEEALRLRPHDAAILSDLAAAEMQRGDVFDAAEHCAEALERDSSAAPAALNW